MTQYNFKLPQELKDKVEKALVDSGLEGKNEFLEDMVQIYSAHLIDSKEDMHEEIAAYKHINTQSKEVLSKTFSHLLSTIDYNFSSMLQEKIEMEEERKKLVEKTTLLDQELDKMKLFHLEERKELESNSKEELRLLRDEKEKLAETLELERLASVKVKEELSSLSVIAEQTSSVMVENKELRASNTLMEKEHREKMNHFSKLHEEKLSEVKNVSAKQVISLEENLSLLQSSLRLEEKKLFEVSHILERCEDDLKVSDGMVQKNLDGFSVKEKDYSLKVEKLSSELITVNSLYNQLLGKVDVLETLEKKK
jgi:hypothetical protein